MALLEEIFSGPVISRRGNYNWGYAKDRAYVDKPSTREHLKINIRQVMAEIPWNIYQKVVGNYLQRINACNTSSGVKLNDVAFHT